MSATMLATGNRAKNKKKTWSILTIKFSGRDR